MEIPTANIFISFDYDTIKKYFLFDKSRFTISDLLTESKRGINSLLLANTGNTDLVSFTHEYGQGSSSVITLKLLDSNNLLFQRLLRSLIQLPDQSLDLENRIFEEAGRELQNKVNENTPRANQPIATSPGTAANPVFGDFLNAVRENANKNLEDIDDLRIGTTQIFKDYAKSLIKLNRSVYISYGVGSDLKSWVGPLKYRFEKISVDAGANRAREFNLSFVSVDSLVSQNSGLNREDIPLESFGYGLICKGFSDPINRKDVLNKILETANTYGEDNFSNEPLQYPVDFHKVIVTTLRRYLAGACNTREGNVLVLLPDINKVVGETITRVYKTDFANFFKLLKRHKTDGFWERAVDDVVKTILNNFGFSVEVKPNPSKISFSVSPISVARAEERKNREDFKDNWDYELVATLNSKFVTDKDNTDKIIEYESFQVPLKVFEDNLKEWTDAKMIPMNFRLFFENDLSILSLWKKYDFIKDEKNPAVVFGTEDMIMGLLYGDNNNTIQSPFIYDEDMKFTNSNYIKEIRALLVANKSPGPFDGLQGLPKLFYADYNVLGIDQNAVKSLQEKIKFVNESNIPIFKSGIKNSNVLEYNLIRDASFDAALQAVFIKQRSYAATNTIKHQHDKEFYKLTKNVKDLYAKFKNWVYKGKTKTDLEITNKSSVNTNLKNIGEEELAKTALYQYMNSLSKDQRPIRYYSEQSGSNAIALHHMLAEDLMKASFRVTVKCLPYFWVSKISDIGKPCLFVCYNPQIFGANKQVETLDFFLTNQYIINGFRHVISTGGVYSEFMILSSPRVAGTVKDTLDSINTK
jgi:hypothetical protein